MSDIRKEKPAGVNYAVDLPMHWRSAVAGRATPGNAS